jgi:hypothetical protein
MTLASRITVYAPRRNWDSPQPQPPTRRLVCPLPPVSGGRGTLAGEKGVGRVPIPTRGIHCGTLYMYVLCAVSLYFQHKAGSLKMNTALEYSTRVVQEGGRRCKKSTLNDLVHLTPLRIPLMNPPMISSSVADPGCLSRTLILPIPDPKTAAKERGEKNLLSYLFCSHKSHIIEHYFIFEMLKKKIWANFQRIIELYTKKIVTRLSKI